MTSLTEHRTLIVPAALRDTANAVACVLDPDVGGLNSFQAGLSASGTEPATHYICAAPLTPQTAAMLDSTDAEPMHAALQQLAAARGRDYTLSLSELQALRDALTVSALGWEQVAAGLGLQIVAEDT